MQADLLALLRTDATLAAMPIEWGRRSQGAALPSIVLNIASETPGYTYGGQDDLVPTRVQADLYAASAYLAKPADDALAALVSGYRGTVGSTEFEGIFLVSRFDEATEQTVGVPLHRISRDLMVHHKET